MNNWKLICTQQKIRDSVNDIIDYFKENPEAARGPGKQVTAIVEEGLRCRAESEDGFSLVSDMPTAVGGGGSAPTPGRFLMAVLANCNATMVALRAAQTGISLHTLEVTVENEWDDHGLFGMNDTIPAGPMRVKVNLRISSEHASSKELHDLINWV